MLISYYRQGRKEHFFDLLRHVHVDVIFLPSYFIFILYEAHTGYENLINAVQKLNVEFYDELNKNL